MKPRGTRVACALALAAAVASGGCGAASDKPGSPAAASSVAPDAPVAHSPSSGPPRGGEAPQRVRPRAGMADVHEIPWSRSRVVSPRAIDVYFWSGVEPCYVLDHVDLRYRRSAVVVTLHQGHDPRREDTVCIELAVEKVVRVDLNEPLRGRRIRDGAR